MSDMATQVELTVLRAVETNALELPSMPLAAARALALLGRTDFSLRQVASIIEGDPIVAARLLRVVHNAAFAGLSRFDSVLTCVTRIGAEELRLFLVETAVHHVMESRDQCIAKMCRDLWRHSLAVAVLSRELLGAVHGIHPDAAYLGGLLHDVGRPVLAATLLAAEHRLVGTRTQRWILPDIWLSIINEKHRAVGVALARKWNLPDTVARAIRDSAEYDLVDPLSNANIVRLANALAKQHGIFVGTVDASDNDAMVFAGQQMLGIDDATAAKLVDNLDGMLANRIG